MASSQVSFDVFADDYSDLVGDVVAAGYETYEQKLQDWLDLIDTFQPARQRLALLEEGVDFQGWYDRALGTVGSMVGSGRLDWERDRTKRLGQQLGLFRHLASVDGAWERFTVNFLYESNRYDDNIAKLNREIFEPFARSLLKDIERNLGTTEAPASDRIVAFDHNASDYVDLVERLEAVELVLRESNAIGEFAPLAKARVSAELAAGRNLLAAPEGRAQAIWDLVYPALKWVGANSGAAAIGVLVTAVIAALAALLGISLPGQ